MASGGIPISSLPSNTRLYFRQQLDGKMAGLRMDRRSWWAHWSDLARLLLPRRYKWFITSNQANRGSAKNQDIVDETGVLACRTCSAGMLSGMASPLRPWFKLKIAVPGFEGNKPVAVWLSQVEDQLYRVFAESNFYSSMGTLYHDLVVFGSAAMLIYEDFDNVINCYNPCLGEFFFASSPALRVNAFYREFTLTVDQAVDQFGLENVSESTRTAYRAGGVQRTREIVICHAIEPNGDLWQQGSPDAKMKVVPEKFPFREVYWEMASQQSGEFLRICGVEEQNFVGARWSITGNDAYGSGNPGMDMYPAVAQLQVEQRRKGEAIDKAVRPPMVGGPEMRNEPSSITPGSVTYVPNTNSTIGFKPAFQVDLNGLQYMLEDINTVQGRVKEVGYVDLFMMISSLETVRTATEIDARREEKLILLGPVVERNQTEVLDVVLDRTIAIMSRHPGVLPLPPPEIAGLPLKVEYVSMLAEAQRAASTASIERVLALAGNLMGVRPDVGDNIDWDDAIREYADRLNVSPKILTAIKQMMQIRQARADEQAQATAMQAGLAGVQAASLLAKSGLMTGTAQQPGAPQ